MKQFILVITIFLILCTSLNGQWEVLNEGGSFETIDFVNENVGWIGGNGTLLKTEDGGETWNPLPLDPVIMLPPDDSYNIRMIDFINESVGWLVAFGDDDIGVISISQDGGLTWSVQKDVSGWEPFYALHALDDSTVYYAGEGTTLKTLNGGTDWIDISSRFNETTFTSVWFVNAEVGVITGYYFHSQDQENKGRFLKTHDGGNTWDSIRIPIFNSIDGLQFVNDSTGYFLASNDDEHFFCATTDTFNTWTIRTQTTYPIHSYFALDDNTIFAVMEDSTSTNVMKSSDGGLSWEKKYVLNNLSFKNIYFNKNNVGFILCDGLEWGGMGGGSQGVSIIMSSMDFGENWRLQKFTYPLYDIYFLDRNKGFACGGFSYGFHGRNKWGDLFYSDNGGKTWYTHSNMPGILETSLFVNDNVGFLLGGEGIWKTTDLGSNWKDVYEGNFGGNDINFINENIGWIVGSHTNKATILHTTDGGENWETDWQYTKPADYPGDSYGLFSVYFVNDITGWTVGEAGLMVKYTEQEQWQVKTKVTDLPLNDVFFSDENHGWIAGGYLNDQDFQSILLKTRDGSVNWQEKKDLNYFISDMYFADSLHGWAVGSDTSDPGAWWQPGRGVILKTSDGGNSWNVQIDDLIAPLTTIHFKDGYGWAVGGNGLVLKTKDGSTWINEKNNITYPQEYKLSQNFPNPFNPKTVISYQLAATSKVDLSIYNLIGQKVATLISRKQPAGGYKIEWDASAFVSGVYLYRLETDNGFAQTKKLILLK